MTEQAKRTEVFDSMGSAHTAVHDALHRWLRVRALSTPLSVLPSSLPTHVWMREREWR